MIAVNQIIADLETMKRSPNMFIDPVTPEMLVCYLQGLNRGVLNSVESLTFEDLIHAHRSSIRVKGWRDRSTSPYHEMREKNVSEEEIIQELLNIEIETWRIIESESTKNLK